MERFRRRVLAGFLAIIPLLITLWVMSFLLDLLIRLGRPFVLALAAAIRPYADDLAELITTTLFQSALAIAFVIVLLYAL